MTKRTTPRRNPKTGRFVSARSKVTRSPATGKRAGRTRRNPYVGEMVAIEYRRPGDPDPRPFRHEAGDRGTLARKGKPAKVYADDKTGRISVKGGMRWVPGRGLVG